MNLGSRGGEETRSNLVVFSADQLYPTLNLVSIVIICITAQYFAEPFQSVSRISHFQLTQGQVKSGCSITGIKLGGFLETLLSKIPIS